MTDNEKKIRERLKTDILSALRRVYAEDGKLLLRDIGVCERSLMHRFTHYFINRIESSRCKIYEGLHVDGEYNRHGIDPKRLAESLIFPDVIVHKRGEDGANLCVIEFKKSLTAAGERRSECDFKRDVEKLRAMTIPQKDGGEFGYQWGVHVIFLSDGVEMKWFCNGVERGEYEKHVLPKRLPQSRAS